MRSTNPAHSPLTPPLRLLQLQRNILATCPRVTRFKIDWGGGLNEQLLPHIEDLPSSSSSVAGTSGTSRPEEEDFDEEEEDDELDDDELVSEDDEEDEDDASEVDIGQEDMDEDMMDEDIENSPGLHTTVRVFLPCFYRLFQ